jgi:hypothetical protein
MLQFFYIKYLTVCFFFEKNWIYIRIHVQQKELGPDPDTMNPDLLFLKKMQYEVYWAHHDANSQVKKS